MNSLTKIIAISLTSFAAVVVLLWVLARPLLADIGEIHVKEAAQKTELNQLSEQLKAYSQAKAQLKEVNYKDSIDHAIVIREDLAEVLAEIEAVALKTNITESIRITEDQPETTTAGKDKNVPKSLIPNEKTISEVAYTVNFSGKFSDTLNFLQYLEHLSHFTEISGLSFNATTVVSSKDEAVHSDIISGTIAGVFFIKKK